MTSYLDRTAPDPRDKEHFAAVAMGVVPDTCVLPGALVLGYHETGEDPCPDCPIDRTICKGRPKKEQATKTPLERTSGLEQGDDAARRKGTRMRWLSTMRKDPVPEEPTAIEAQKDTHAHRDRLHTEDGRFAHTPRKLPVRTNPARPVATAADPGKVETK